MKSRQQRREIYNTIFENYKKFLESRINTDILLEEHENVILHLQQYEIHPSGCHQCKYKYDVIWIKGLISSEDPDDTPEDQFTATLKAYHMCLCNCEENNHNIDYLEEGTVTTPLLDGYIEDREKCLYRKFVCRRRRNLC